MILVFLFWCLYRDWFCGLTWQKVYIWQEFWNMRWLTTEFDCPEVTLCSWQDSKIQLLINLLLKRLRLQISTGMEVDDESCYSRTPWWETTLLTSHPDERPPWWQTIWWKTTLLTSHPDDRPSDKRPPYWQATLMTDHLTKDHPDDRPSDQRPPWWQTIW